jgi:threonine dehydrogenase-like Zn-dependent dehydrogenase
MKQTGRAALLQGCMGHFLIEEAPIPVVRPGHILVRMELCGICGTDIHFYRGHAPSETSFQEGIPFPLVLGHEPVGVIEALGAGVTTDYTGRPIKVGDRVFIASLIACNHCYFCMVEAQPSLCQNLKSYSHKPFPDEPPHFQGGFAQYMDLQSNIHVLRMDDVDPSAVVMLEPLACGLRAVDKADFRPPSTVVIQGAGTIGLVTLIAAKECGAFKTFVIGAPAARLEIARKLGADDILNIDEVKDPQKRIQWIKERTLYGLGADIVFEATGVPQSVPEGIAMVRKCGQYITMGHFTNSGSVLINPFEHFTANEITLRGVYGSHQAGYIRAREIIESKKYPFEEMVTHRIPLDGIEDAFRQMLTGFVLDGLQVLKAAVDPWLIS